MKIQVSAAVLAFMAYAMPLAAQPVAFNPPLNVSSTAGQLSDTTAVAVGGATTYVAWREVVPAAQEIRLRRSTNGAVSFVDGASGLLVTTIDPAETIYAVRVAASGSNVYVLYTSGVEPRLAKARLARSTDSGATFVAPVTLADQPDAGGTAFADLAVDGTGGLHVVIESRDADEDIKYLVSADQGLTFAAAPLSATPAPSSRPRIDASGSRVAVVWEELVPGGGGSDASDIAFMYSSDGGASFGPLLNLSSSAADSKRPVISIGNLVHVVWTEADSVLIQDSLDGATFSAAQQLAIAPAGESIAGSAVGSSANTVHVSWTTADADGAMNGPFYRRSLDGAGTFAAVQDLGDIMAGRPFGVPVIVNDTAARVVWSHSPSGFEPDADVYAAAEPICSSFWKTAISGNWNDATKWSPAAIPTVGSTACITADGAPYTVTVPGAMNAGVLTIGHATSEHRPTVRITGTLTIGSSMVNSGEVTFGSGAQLSSASGSVIISKPGRLTTQAGAPATVNATITNYGVVELAANLTFVGGGKTFTNVGDFTVAPTASTIFGASFVFNQNGGLLTVAGTMALSAENGTIGDIFNFNGGAVEGVVTILGHSHLRIGAGSIGKGTFQFQQNVIYGISSGGNLSGNIAPLQTIRLVGTPSSGTAQANVAGGVTNAGNIELTASAANAGTAVLSIGGTMINTGRIVTQRPDNLNVGRIDGIFENRGTMDLDGGLTFGSNGRLTNLGTINVATGVSVVFGGNYVFNQNGGVLQNAGKVEMSGENGTSGDTFNFNDGTVDGEVIIQGHSRLNIGAGSVGAGTFAFERNVIFGISSGGFLSGNIAAAQTVRLRSAPSTTAQATAAAGFTNFGTLILESTTPTSGGVTLISTAGTLINQGTLLVNDMQPGKALRGHLENRGAMTVMSPLSLQLANGTFNNFGDLTVGPNGKITLAPNALVTQTTGTMTLDGPIELATEFSTAPDLFNFAGGNITGAAGVHLTSTSRLNIAPTAADGAGRFVYRFPNNSGGGTLTGAIGKNMTLRLQGNAATVANGLTNAGTIIFSTEGGNATPSLHVTAGVLVNTGTITVEPIGTVAPINAVIENHGRIAINDTIQLTRANASHLNDGELEIAAGFTLTVASGTLRNAAPGKISGGGTLTIGNGSFLAGVGAFGVNVINNGRFRPGASPGVVDITGTYTQGGTGRLEIELAGFGAGALFDKVNVSGVATLAGTLEVQIVPGACTEGSYQIMTYASVVNDFTTKLGLTPGGGRTITASKGANAYALNVTGPPCNQAPVANPDAYTTNQGTTLTVAAPGVLANDTDAQNDALSALLVTGPANGTLVLDGSGSFVYTPQPTFAGTDSFTYRASDATAQSGSATVTISVVGEMVPPVTTATLSEAANAQGWHRAAVTVTLNSDDGPNGSGLDHIQVSVDGSPARIVEGSTASVLLEDEGVHTIRYFAADNAGNTEVEKDVTVRIDMTPPTASVTRTPANEHGWNNSDVTVGFSAEDALSGIDGAATAEVIRSDEGTDQSATASFMDLAGNGATFTVEAIHIDMTPPVVSGTRQTAPNQFGWNNVPVIVSFTATDALSGVAGDAAAGVTVDGEGAAQAASAHFTDLAGNTASTAVADINIDMTAPAIDATPDRAPNEHGWYNTDVSVTFSCADALSGVDACDTSSHVIGEEGVNLSRQGAATDRAGNTAQTTLGGINIDKTAPAITGAPDRAPNQHGWYNADVTIAFTCTDALSGIDACDPSSQVIGEEGVNLSRQGVATDLAGNTAQTTVGNVNIDKTAPAITGMPDRAPNADGRYTATVTITFTCSDALSGVAACEPPSAVINEEGENLSRTGVATDRAGNTAQITVGNINIDLPEAPMSCTATASPGTLWSPNHKLVPVQSTVTAIRAAGAVTFRLVQATSSEADNGLGDGDTANDIQGFTLGTADMNGLFRSERAGGGRGRIYSLVYQGTDAAGHTTMCIATVIVPHDQGQGSGKK